MKIYDYHEEYALAIAGMLLLIILCLSVLTFLIVKGIASIKKHGFHSATVLILCSMIIPLVAICFALAQTFQIIRYDRTCSTGRYESAIGPLQIHSVERNDYRDTEQYDIVFSVDGTLFDQTNSFSIEQKDQLMANTGQEIEVRYAYIKKEPVIYQIVTCADE